MNGTSPSKRLAHILALSGAAFALCGAVQAQAQTAQTVTGKVRVGWSQVIRYENFDPANPADRLALLSQIESVAAAYCDRPMARIDRDTCAKTTIDRSLRDANPAVGQALMQTWRKRDSQQQASR